ncbi:MAG: hypothetical protein BWX70_02485 [Verrucomicrobia bacterium ADurb.Bin070]|nr:MAG: hypothetical protein BWX70_02485 [Verrucomicrobia bacterium ADurb.Bin070]
MLYAIALNWTLPDFTRPVNRAMRPTHRMSSVMVMPKIYFVKRRALQPISWIVFASSVVAESLIAAPRKRLCTVPHPKILVPTKWPAQIMTAISNSAVGKMTCPTFLSFWTLNSKPSVNIRKITPICPSTSILPWLITSDPPKVYLPITAPATI